MRRALLMQLPALCRFYGLKPWDVDRLTLRELYEFRVQLDEAMRQE